MENKPHGLTGKPSNATKPDDQKAESYIHARCARSDKAGWVKAAQSKGMKLTEWIVSVLNAAAKTGEKAYGSGNTKVRLLTNDQTQQHDKFMQIVSGGEIIAALDSDLVDDATKFMEENHPEITDYRVDFLPKIVINKDKSNK